MKIFEFPLKQPLFINLLSIFIIIGGIVALSSMNRDMFPNVDYERVVVTTVYDGATPRDVEKLITIPIEKELKEVDDIEEMTSASIENFSIISLKIDPDADDKEKIVTDIQRAVDKADDLPTDLPDDPVVDEMESKDIPIIEISLSGKLTEKELQQHAKVLEEHLFDMAEVSAVNRKGWRDKEIWVEVDPDLANEYYIALSEIMRDLAKRNVSVPGGELIREEKEFLLRTTGEFETVDEIKKVIIRANDKGNWVRVGDVSEVTSGFEEEQRINKTNGHRAISLTVVKKESADAIDLVDKIKKMVSEYREHTPESLQIRLINDYSYYIQRRLNVLVQNGFLGILFVLFILVILLNPKVALVTAVGIPIAFMITFFVMMSMGMNINLISLFGLILVLGMLVDDAIVVSENVFRHIENGMPFKKAALTGTLEVWKPVTSTVLTTIAAFMPLMFMTGIMGKFVWSIPVVVIIALIASLLEAFFILPAHLAEIGRLPDKGIIGKLDFKKPQQILNKITEYYSSVLKKALGRRYFVSGGVLLLLITTLLIAVFFLPVVLFPAKGIDVFFVRAKMPVGTPLEVTEKHFRKLEDLVETIPDYEMDDYVTDIGIRQDDPDDPFAQRGSHLGQISVYLKPSADRERETQEIINELRKKGEDIEGFEEINFDKITPGPPVGKPIEVSIRGDNLTKIDDIAETVKSYLRTVSGVKDVKDDFEEGKSELRIVVNESEATRAGLMVADVAKAVRNAYDGGIATTIRKADEDIDVRVRFPYESKYDKSKLNKIMIENNRGDLIPLKVIASYVTKPGVSSIEHLERRRVVNVTANIDQDITTSVEVTEKLKDKFDNFLEKYPGYTISFGGEYEETEKSMKSLSKAFILSIVLIFLILATNFKSIVQPLIVMMAIPFGLIGVILMFLVHGLPLSFLALLGVVGLSGVVVNSSIILMDFINKRRDEGASRRDAIIEAGMIRLRPVLITALTTVLGLLPVAYGLWGSDPILIPAALALMWGLIFATGLTLIVIPCFYAIFDDLRDRLVFMKFWKDNGKKI